MVVPAAGAVTVVPGAVTVAAGTVTVRVGVCTVTFVVFVVFAFVTVRVTGLDVVLPPPPPFEATSAITTPATSATTPAITSAHPRERLGRIGAPQVGQNSAPGGTPLPQLGQTRVGSSPLGRGSSVIGGHVPPARVGRNHPDRVILRAR